MNPLILNAKKFAKAHPATTGIGAVLAGGLGGFGIINDSLAYVGAEVMALGEWIVNLGEVLIFASENL